MTGGASAGAVASGGFAMADTVNDGRRAGPARIGVAELLGDGVALAAYARLADASA